MGSPSRRSEYARSSPSRSRANANRTSVHRNSLHEIEVYEEFARLVLDKENDFKKKLDQQSLEQQKKHEEALDIALAKHNALRISAEKVIERVRLEAEAERVRLEREEDIKREEARRKLADELRKKEEAAYQAELKRRQEEEQQIAARKRQEEEEERARQQAVQRKIEAEKRAREQADAEKAAAEQAAKQKQEQALKASNGQTNGTPATTAPKLQEPAQHLSATTLPAGIVRSSEECLALYNQYIEIHGRLKQLRIELPARAKQDQRLRNLSDWRRELTKLLGQVNVSDKAANREIVGVPPSHSSLDPAMLT